MNEIDIASTSLRIEIVKTNGKKADENKSSILTSFVLFTMFHHCLAICFSLFGFCVCSFFSMTRQHNVDSNFYHFVFLDSVKTKIENIRRKKLIHFLMSTIFFVFSFIDFMGYSFLLCSWTLISIQRQKTCENHLMENDL